MAWNAIVVGAGIVGLSAARRLVTCGVGNVLVIEQKFPASAASGLGTGSVHCQRWRALDVELVMRSKEILADLERPTNGLTRLKPTGRLTLVGPDDTAHLVAYAEMIEQHGIEMLLLDPAELSQRFPYLHLEDVGLGSLTPADGVVSPPSIASALAGLIRLGGGTIWEGVTATRVVVNDGQVVGVELEDGETISSDRVVVATGPWTQKFLEGSGITLPNKRVVTQNTVIRLKDGHPSWSMPNILDVPGNQTTFIPRNPGNICVGGWAGPQAEGDDAVGFEGGARSDGFYDKKMLEIANHRFSFGTIGGIVGGWKGVVDVTPDRLPLIGQADDAQGLFVACGLGGYGIQRGPAVGEVVADLARGAPPRVGVDSCSPQRFTDTRGDDEFNVHTDTDNAFTVRVGA